MSNFQLICGDVKESLYKIKDKVFHCCITSPPYFHLRDYFTQNQIGHEETPDQYVDNIVSACKEIYRVLRDDGVFFLNLGDTYSTPKRGNTNNTDSNKRKIALHAQKINKKLPYNLKTKNLIGIPWKVAFALQEQGWYLRCDIVWGKKNPRPDGAKDRPTRCHEFLFMLTKSDQYFYDYYSIMEDTDKIQKTSRKFGANEQKGTYRNDENRTFVDYGKRNKRSIWLTSVATGGGKHMAVFPEDLIRPAILSATSKYGCCPKCKTPWYRIVIKHKEQISENYFKAWIEGNKWEPGCNCNITNRERCIVLDPFCGISTTGSVCLKHHLDYVGIDIKQEYINISRTRLNKIEPIFSQEIQGNNNALYSNTR